MVIDTVVAAASAIGDALGSAGTFLATAGDAAAADAAGAGAFDAGADALGAGALDAGSDALATGAFDTAAGTASGLGTDFAAGFSPTLDTSGLDALAAGSGGATTGAAAAGSGGLGIGTASLASGLLNAGGQIIGSQEAAQAQTNAANKAIAAQQQYFGTAQQNLQPFINTGTSAANQIANLEGLNGAGAGGIQSTLQSLPGYQFANYQGLKSTQNSATARGLGVSGAAQKGAADYSTGLANEYYNNYLSGLQNTENTGSNAASGLASAAVNTGSAVGSNLTNAGTAQAAADVSTGSAIGNAANSIPTNLLLSSLIQNNGGVAGSSGSNSNYWGPF